MGNESVGLFTRSETKLGIAKVPVSNVKELVRGWHGLPVAKPYCNPRANFCKRCTSLHFVILAPPPKCEKLYAPFLATLVTLFAAHLAIP
mgnify:FL=1